MAMQQIKIQLSDDTIRKINSHFSPRQRLAFIERTIEQAVASLQETGGFSLSGQLGGGRDNMLTRAIEAERREEARLADLSNSAPEVLKPEG